MHIGYGPGAFYNIAYFYRYLPMRFFLFLAPVGEKEGTNLVGPYCLPYKALNNPYLTLPYQKYEIHMVFYNQLGPNFVYKNSLVKKQVLQHP